MPITAICLIVLAAFFHAGWNLLLHDTEDRESAMAVAGIASGIALLPAMFIWPPWSVFPLIPLSAVAQSLYALGLAAAYRRGMLAVTYPVARGTAPLLVTLGGWIVLGQRPAPLAWCGAALLALGLALIVKVGRDAAQGVALLFASVTGVAIASYSLIDARAVRDVEPTGYLGSVLLVQGVLLAGWIRMTRPSYLPQPPTMPSRPWTVGTLAYLARSLRPGLLIGAGSTIAYLLVVFALQRADAGRVSTFREVSILLGLVLARQKFDRAAWIGASCVVAGVLLAAM